MCLAADFVDDDDDDDDDSNGRRATSKRKKVIIKELDIFCSFLLAFAVAHAPPLLLNKSRYVLCSGQQGEIVGIVLPFPCECECVCVCRHTLTQTNTG